MPRPDQSMSLLTDLQEHALEPGYHEAARNGHPRSPRFLGLGVAVLAALLVLGGVSTNRSSGDLAAERAELEARVEEGQRRQGELEAEVTSLAEEIRRLGEEQVTDPELRAELDRLAPLVGDAPVTGPGVVIEVSDAPNRSGAEGLVYDDDLVRLVNGLRQAGAEAIAVNGRRITTLTPIRTAGVAITIDYVSLSPPYVVEAIGDPATMQARFARTSASVWWKYISDNFGVGFSFREAETDLELAADPGMNLRFAEA